MKKIFILIAFIVFLGFCTPVFAEYGLSELNLRPAKTITLPKGSFIKLTNIREFSSQFVDNGDEVVMVCNYDIYIGETRLIPENSKFYGHIEEVREPVQGTNAALVIKMDKFITPDDVEYKIDGYLSASNGDLFLGGERTPPMYYVRMPHYSQWRLSRFWKVTAGQYVETNTRMFGAHTVVKSGAEIIMVLQDNFDLTQ